MREKGRTRPKGSPIYMSLIQLDCRECPHYCGDSTHFCADFTLLCVNFTHFHGDSTHLCVDSTNQWKPLLGMSGLFPDCPWAVHLCLRYQYQQSMSYLSIFNSLKSCFTRLLKRSKLIVDLPPCLMLIYTYKTGLPAVTQTLQAIQSSVTVQAQASHNTSLRSSLC
jgi:hypothetical protein